MNLNKANRQCCDCDIRDYKTNAPFMFADFSNTTTAGFTGDSVYAMKKGSKAIAFHNPIEGTMSMEFQAHPFKVYSLLSDGTLESKAIIPQRQNITASAEGTLTLPTVTDGTIIVGSVFVNAEDDFGGKFIEGTVVASVFTAKEASSITTGTTYTVSFLLEKTKGVNKIAFNNKKIPKDYRITQQTLDKNEDGDLVPMLLTAYKATVKRTLSLSHSSTGDPATIKIDFDVLEDRDGNVLDMVEITDSNP